MVRNIFEAEVNGKKVGFKCGTMAIAIACRESNTKTVNELIDRMMQQDLLAVLALFYGSACQYHNQRSPELTMDMVGDWIEEIGEAEMLRATNLLLESFIPKNHPAPHGGVEPETVYDWEVLARTNLGMNEKTFWSLGLYDWTLWVQKIKFDNEKEESEWIRLSHLEALLANINRDSKRKPTPYEMEDFYKPSWVAREEIKEEDRTPEEILSKFSKKI